MKTSEIRELSSEEIHQELAERKQELFNLRFQRATEKLENPMRFKHIRREVARMRTILRERDLAGRAEG